jgi:hypothetical protein
MVGVPFKRPVELAGQTEVSNEEFAKRQAEAQRRTAADLEQFVSTAPRAGDGTGPPSHWLEWGKPSRQASLVVEPADGKVPPLTAEGQKRMASHARSARVHLSRDLQQRQPHLAIALGTS